MKSATSSVSIEAKDVVDVVVEAMDVVEAVDAADVFGFDVVIKALVEEHKEDDC
jgi:hypothetical protein